MKLPINRTLQYLAMSIQTLPEVQNCLKIILEKKPLDYMGIFINDARYIATSESDTYLFLKVSQAACDYIVSKADNEVIDYYKNPDKTAIVVIEPKMDIEGWKMHFVKGEYSKIYTDKQLRKFNLNDDTDLGKIRNSVLFKRKEYWDDFKLVLDKEFGGINLNEGYDGRELDLPPKLSEEILNYKPM